MHVPILRRMTTKVFSMVLATVAFVAPVPLHGRHSLSAQGTSQPRVLIFGGGSSHNFEDNYGKLDLKTLTAAGDVPRYTDSFTKLSRELPSVNVLIQASNQIPGPDSDAQQAIKNFVGAGGGLIVVHAGTWYNWPAWPEYNRLFVDGGSRSHDKFVQFEVTVIAPRHPIMKGVPVHFKVTDELYHQEMDSEGPAVEVLATATSPITGKTYPIIWVVKQGRGRIVCMTLGHDEKTHGDPAYERLLVNATSWAAGSSPEPSGPH